MKNKFIKLFILHGLIANNVFVCTHNDLQAEDAYEESVYTDDDENDSSISLDSDYDKKNIDSLLDTTNQTDAEKQESQKKLKEMLENAVNSIVDLYYTPKKYNLLNNIFNENLNFLICKYGVINGLKNNSKADYIKSKEEYKTEYSNYIADLESTKDGDLQQRKKFLKEIKGYKGEIEKTNDNRKELKSQAKSYKDQMIKNLDENYKNFATQIENNKNKYRNNIANCDKKILELSKKNSENLKNKANLENKYLNLKYKVDNYEANQTKKEYKNLMENYNNAQKNFKKAETKVCNINPTNNQQIEMIKEKRQNQINSQAEYCKKSSEDLKNKDSSNQEERKKLIDECLAIQTQHDNDAYNRINDLSNNIKNCKKSLMEVELRLNNSSNNNEKNNSIIKEKKILLLKYEELKQSTRGKIKTFKTLLAKTDEIKKIMQKFMNHLNTFKNETTNIAYANLASYFNLLNKEEENLINYIYKKKIIEKKQKDIFDSNRKKFENDFFKLTQSNSKGILERFKNWRIKNIGSSKTKNKPVVIDLNKLKKFAVSEYTEEIPKDLFKNTPIKKYFSKKDDCIEQKIEWKWENEETNSSDCVESNLQSINNMDLIAKDLNKRRKDIANSVCESFASSQSEFAKGNLHRSLRSLTNNDLNSLRVRSYNNDAGDSFSVETLEFSVHEDSQSVRSDIKEETEEKYVDDEDTKDEGGNTPDHTRKNPNYDEKSMFSNCFLDISPGVIVFHDKLPFSVGFGVSAKIPYDASCEAVMGVILSGIYKKFYGKLFIGILGINREREYCYDYNLKIGYQFINRFGVGINIGLKKNKAWYFGVALHKNNDLFYKAKLPLFMKDGQFMLDGGINRIF